MLLVTAGLLFSEEYSQFESKKMVRRLCQSANFLIIMPFHISFPEGVYDDMSMDVSTKNRNLCMNFVSIDSITNSLDNSINDNNERVLKELLADGTDNYEEVC